MQSCYKKKKKKLATIFLYTLPIRDINIINALTKNLSFTSESLS